jgi:hypothetical protein
VTWTSRRDAGGCPKRSPKTNKARWVPVYETIFAAVVDLVPREDRDVTARVFVGT